VAGPRARGFASGPGGVSWRESTGVASSPPASRRAPTATMLNRYPMSDILRPFELTAAMCRMHWMIPLLLLGAQAAARAGKPCESLR
jgi:glutathione-regulated potassium-efflux system ancillary protein KefG